MPMIMTRMLKGKTHHCLPIITQGLGGAGWSPKYEDRTEYSRIDGESGLGQDQVLSIWSGIVTVISNA